MLPRILFPANSNHPRKPDFAFEGECAAAIEAGFDVSFVGLELHFGEAVQLRGIGDEPGSMLYRGWMMNEGLYERVERALADEGKTLITSTEQYLYAYHFPNWYRDLEGLTPKSAIFPEADVDTLIKTDTLLPAMLFNHFGGPKALMVKDYVKSRKHEWFEACFIPQGTKEAVADWDQGVMYVVRNFVDRQAEFFVGGLVVREFVQLKRIGVHTKSRLPLVNEHRFFCVNGEVVYQAPYWGEGDYSGAKPTPDDIATVLPRISAPFVTVDVAERESGGWVVIEIGDGGTSGIPEGGNALAFYQALHSVYSRG